jgi:hypothetical protein
LISLISSSTFNQVFFDNKAVILSKFSPVFHKTKATLEVKTTTLTISCSIETRISPVGIHFNSLFKIFLTFKSIAKSFLYDFLFENQEDFQVLI